MSNEFHLGRSILFAKARSYFASFERSESRLLPKNGDRANRTILNQSSSIILSFHFEHPILSKRLFHQLKNTHDLKMQSFAKGAVPRCLTQMLPFI
eukprot:UN15275